MSTNTPQAVYRKDYQPPAYWVQTVDLEFELGEEHADVRATLAFSRDKSSKSDEALVLVGEDMELLEVKLDGTVLEKGAYSVNKTSLTIPAVPETFVLSTTVRIEPQNNTSLSGLYRTSGNFCTQCEAMGFRRITYFLDRPDVMAKYTTRIEADKGKYPVLLSNGNRDRLEKRLCARML
jgi:aminopeptidase N